VPQPITPPYAPSMKRYLGKKMFNISLLGYCVEPQTWGKTSENLQLEDENNRFVHSTDTYTLID